MGDVQSDDGDESYSYQKQRRLTNLIQQMSLKIERYLNFKLDIQERTEYHDVEYGQFQFFTKAFPVISIDSVHEDTSGVWDGSGTEISDVAIGKDNFSVLLPIRLFYTGSKAIKVVYTGGMAYSGTDSTFTVGDTTDWGAGKFCIGSSSSAYGIVSSVADGTTLVVQNLQGIFTQGETISQYTEENPDDRNSASASTSIVSIDKQSLAESYPDLVLACEMEVNYHFAHVNNYQDISMSRDGTSTYRDRYRRPTEPFTAETLQILNTYRRYPV